MWVLLKLPRFGGAKHHATTTIGLDIAKSVFQVHGVDTDGQVVIRRQLKRRYVLAFFEKRGVSEMPLPMRVKMFMDAKPSGVEEQINS